jgi:hypothetical protein
MVKAVIVEPVLQMAQAVPIEILERVDPVTVKPVLQVAKAVTIEPSSTPTLAEQLQIKKANLTKTDLGAQVYGYDKPAKTGPELVEASSSIGIMSQKIVHMDPPKLEMGPIIEVSSVTVAEPKPKLEMHQAVETVAVIVNPISGNIITPQVAQKVQEIRQVLDTSLPQAPKKDNGKEALEMLNGKSSKEALEAISTAIGKGDGKLVKAMMDIIDKPPEGTKIPSVGKMALNKIYTDQMESTKGMKLDQDRSKVQRAAGAIADKAGIVDHEKRAMKPKASGPER